MEYTPIIEDPGKLSDKVIALSSCSTLAGAVIMRKMYIDGHFKKDSLMTTKSKADAITAVALGKLKESRS